MDSRPFFLPYLGAASVNSREFVALCDIFL
jgi:hypothetical protein